MNEAIKYFQNLFKEKPFEKEITVYGWQYNYQYQLISSICPYLFDELKIIENFASLNNQNRDGRIKEKKYIVIHDTGETSIGTNAKFWSNVVKTQNLNGNIYKASFQYVVGNDGIYHNIPDNEVAYHAGDTTEYDYCLYDTAIKETKNCNLTVENGFYFINGINTNISLNNQTLQTKDLNDFGILIKKQNGRFYLGETYYNQTYQKIANRGGNNNGIGIEICINQNDDIYLNYHLVAKLIVKLLKEFNLTIDDIKPHHFFSGKNCPQTIRENHLWDEFIKMVEVEKDVDELISKGYQIKLIPISDNILKNGRIINLSKPLKFKIQTIYQNQTEEYEFNL